MSAASLRGMTLNEGDDRGPLMVVAGVGAFSLGAWAGVALLWWLG